MEITHAGVNRLFEDTLWWAKIAEHDNEISRNGAVRTYQTPLTICNLDPRRRVLLNRKRNPNPFFQLMECIWMFAGSNSDWIVQFNKRMAEYMDYGSFHGAYGHRWANYTAVDQIAEVIDMLRKTPNTRRAYVALWDADADLNQDYQDLPCNVGVAFQLRKGKLNGYVFNRSNDLIWGMLGTNCVHFSMLLEVVADCAGLPMGELYQTTINPHIYAHHWDFLDNPSAGQLEDNPACSPLHVEDYEHWVSDSQMFLKLGPEGIYRHEWFSAVAIPMYRAYIERRQDAIREIMCPAWKYAASLWWELNRSHPTEDRAAIPQPKVGVGDQGVE